MQTLLETTLTDLADTGAAVADQGDALSAAWQTLYTVAAVIIGVLLLLCLVRAIRGPRIADRVIAVNMMGTMTVILICILAFLLHEAYLMDIAMIYTMLSFLAVVLLTRITIGAYRRRRAGQRREEEQADD